MNAKIERALNALYAEIPQIPDCQGWCAESCGPIAMFEGEWKRVKRAARRTPRLAPNSITCPLLSPNGRCTIYLVRPYICRLWGATRAMACPKGCTPERWLTPEEAHDIFLRLRELVGPEIKGTFRPGDDLWKMFAIEPREQRRKLIEQIEQRALAEHDPEGDPDARLDP